MMMTNVSKIFEINSRILQLIDYYGLSNNKFATEIGISSSRMSNIATNRNRPDSEMLSKIADKYTNINMAWVLTGKGEMIIDPSSHLNEPGSYINEPKTMYNSNCIECKEKQRQIDKLQNTIDNLIEESKKDHELIRKFILRQDGI